MLYETDKYYIPNKYRAVVLPIVWREEFNIQVQDMVLVGRKENALIISAECIFKSNCSKAVKVGKKGVVKIPKELDEQLESDYYKLFVDPQNRCFHILSVA
ncbi:hypothetical protein QUF84_20980 [Fictibacillus enclensis]|uniref:hypothetical protein n=1 Tax=Fictibacillus enclensis TaxID=1017270 RepID=UPI0025A08C7E|nr:hypothetical protein [Fictibacillus enclensis]MDM5339677.1 hypothetical protein [Fictibacillus enclensis]